MKHIIIKILLLTTVFAGIFYAWTTFLNAQNTNIQPEIKNQNTSQFSTPSNKNLGRTSVAIASNIGLKFNKNKEISSTIYKEIFSISDLIKTTKYNENKLLAKNYVLIQEYRNLLKTDFKDYIDSSLNKQEVLDAILWQLEYRYIDANSNIQNLNKQKEILLSAMNQSSTVIDSLKWNMSRNYNSFDIDNTYTDIQKYVEAKEQFYHAKVFIVYINVMLRDYQVLNKYNKLLLDTMINNKQAIINNSYVVLPDSGTQLLKDFDLLYTEEQFKAKK